MVARNTRTRRSATPSEATTSANRARRTAPAEAAPASAPRRGRPVGSTNKPKPVVEEAVSAGRDLSQYENYEPTPYQKAFATWLVKEVGFRPSLAGSAKEAFLQGVALATATRPAFNDSEFLEEWRKKNGVAKRGPKPQLKDEEEAEPNRRTRRAKAEPEPVAEDDDDFDDDEIDDDDDDSDDDDDFDDDSDDEDDSDDDDFDDDEPEPEPAPRRRGRPAKATAAPAKVARQSPRAPAAKATPAAKRGRPAAKTNDDFMF